MMTEIIYQRSAKEYQVIDTDTGEIAETFPARHKAQAEQYAVALANGRLASIVQNEMLAKRPYLQARAWKAAALVIDGKISPANEGGPYFAYVTGQGDVYALGMDANLISCTCTDFQLWQAPIINTAGQRACKHILAWHLFKRLQQRRCYSCGQLVPADSEYCPKCGELVTPF